LTSILYRYKNTGTTGSPWTTCSPKIRLGTRLRRVPWTWRSTSQWWRSGAHACAGVRACAGADALH